MQAAGGVHTELTSPVWQLIKSDGAPMTGISSQAVEWRVGELQKACPRGLTSTPVLVVGECATGCPLWQLQLQAITIAGNCN